MLGYPYYAVEIVVDNHAQCAYSIIHGMQLRKPTAPREIRGWRYKMTTVNANIWFDVSLLAQNIGLDDVNQLELRKVLFHVAKLMEAGDEAAAEKQLAEYKSKLYEHRGDAFAQ